MNFTHRLLSRFFLFLFTMGFVLPCSALEPDPRMWNHIPMDSNFGGFAFAKTKADIFIDPTLELQNVEMKLDTWAAKYIRTFELFEKSARIDITQAYQDAKWTGLLQGAPAATSRSGLSDTLVRVAISLFGAPPLRGKEFSAYRSNMTVETIVGAALVVRIPTGDYQKDKLLNLGQNRFTFRPQLGIIHTRGKWTTELTGEIAFYTTNDAFFNGNTLEQKPLYIVHGHLIRALSPGEWLAFSVGYDYGGENTLNGVDKNDTKEDIAWKLSYSYPINRTSGLKISYLNTRTQKSIGFDSETLIASMSFGW